MGEPTLTKAPLGHAHIDSSTAKFVAAMEHPEGITDDRIERQAREIHASICGCAAAPDEWCDSIYLVASERGLRAALFPGDGPEASS